MATYVISDIHGAYEEFKRLLTKTGFHYDGSDELYLLGDFIDWGKYSIRTLLEVMDLDRKYEFVHCTIGNHEAMFLETVDGGYQGGTPDPYAANWLFINRGIRTWQEFAALSKSNQEEILCWLRSLPLSYTVRIGEVNYMLAHAYPYFTDPARNEDDEILCRNDAVWRRLSVTEDPFESYKGDIRYDILICGHTVSDFYMQQLKGVRRWIGPKPKRTAKNRVFFAEYFIDIDCGAKLLHLSSEDSDVLKTAAMRAQLAAIRLEDLQCFYIGKERTEPYDRLRENLPGLMTMLISDSSDRKVELKISESDWDDGENEQ